MKRSWSFSSADDPLLWPGPGLDVGVVQLRIKHRFQFRDGMAAGEDGDTGDVVTFPAPLP